MATDVEVTRYLLDGKAANKSASISFLKCLLCHFQLFHLVGLPQQLEIFAVQIIAGWVETPLFDWTDIGVVGHHDILQVQGDDLAWEFGELYVNIDAEYAEMYLSSLRVNNRSIEIIELSGWLK